MPYISVSPGPLPPVLTVGAAHLMSTHIATMDRQQPIATVITLALQVVPYDPLITLTWNQWYPESLHIIHDKNDMNDAHEQILRSASHAFHTLMSHFTP